MSEKDPRCLSQSDEDYAGFVKRCMEAFEKNPVMEFAQELFDSGMTEDALQQSLSRLSTLPTPFKIALHNHFRDIKQAACRIDK